MLRVIAAVLCSLCGPALSDEVTCADGRAKVWTQHKELAARVCAVASDGIDQLTACNLRQTRPVRISILDRLEAANAECVGRYLCHAGRIEILSPKAMQDAIQPDSAYHDLPGMEVFDSFLVHELAHALIHQTLDGQSGSVAQNEYVAYAMQLASIPPETREALIAPYRKSEGVSLEELNGFILGFAPDRFAARAWLHFSEPQNGCDFVSRILEGTVLFGEAYP